MQDFGFCGAFLEKILTGIPQKVGTTCTTYTLGQPPTQTHTDIMTDKLIEVKDKLQSLVFIDEETNAIVIHVYGFSERQIALSFAAKMLKKAGVNYTPLDDLFNLPQTIN
jgi:hypothetical protein